MSRAMFGESRNRLKTGNVDARLARDLALRLTVQDRF